MTYRNVTLKSALSAAFLSLALAGCATTIQPVERKSSTTSSERAAAARMSEIWDSTAVEKEGHSAIILSGPKKIPAEIRNRPIRLNLETGVTLQDVAAVLGQMGFNVVLSEEGEGTGLANRKVRIPRFNGKLGHFLANLSKSSDVWVTYQNGALYFSPKERISITLPQEEALAIKVSEGLSTLKIEDAAVSWTAGLVSLNLTPSEFERTRGFLDRISANASIVTLQVAIISVNLDQDAKQGIDWEKLQVAVTPGMDPRALYKNTINSNGTGSTNTGGSNTNTNTNNANAQANAPKTGEAVLSNVLTENLGTSAALGAFNGGLGGVAVMGRFVFSGLFDYLQTYGETETLQNVVLKTVAGSPVKLESLTQIPYVEDIGVTSTGASGSNNSNGALGSAKTAKANEGLTLEMIPSFDAAANTVTVSMEMALEAVIAFNELSAGNQLGTLTQPTTAKRAFNDTLRVRPGQTVVVGGLTYDSVTDNKGGPIALKGSRWERQTMKVTRQSMFIVVRPTVLSLGTIVEGGLPTWEDEADYEPFLTSESATGYKPFIKSSN
jgi:type II secretory pathway component GspD/PulD (secretin)